MSFRYIDPNIQDPVHHPEYTDEYDEAYYTELREAFRLFDRDNDGLVSTSEVCQLLKYLQKWDFIAEAKVEDIEKGEEQGEDAKQDEEQGDKEQNSNANKTDKQDDKTQQQSNDSTNSAEQKKEQTSKQDSKSKPNKSDFKQDEQQKEQTDSNQEEQGEDDEVPLEDRLNIPEPTDEEVRDMIKFITGRLGVMDHINFTEFCKLMQTDIENTTVEDQFRETFNILDKDRDGFISQNEFRDALIEMAGIENASNDDVAKFMKELDYDGDSQLSYEDFIKLFISMSEKEGSAAWVKWRCHHHKKTFL